jgi:hypothetical protein
MVPQYPTDQFFFQGRRPRRILGLDRRRHSFACRFRSRRWSCCYLVAIPVNLDEMNPVGVADRALCRGLVCFMDIATDLAFPSTHILLPVLLLWFSGQVRAVFRLFPAPADFFRQ